MICGTAYTDWEGWQENAQVNNLFGENRRYFQMNGTHEAGKGAA